MNTKSRAEAKNDFEKNFFKLMNNSAFGKTMKNVRKHRDIKLAATKRKMKKKGRNAEMKKAKVKMNKAKYLGMSILDISKTLMYEFWYDYIKPKYQEKAKLCYMDTDSVIIYIKIEDFYEDIANDVENQFDASNYDEDDKRPLPIGKNKKNWSF